ncbi:MAG: GyrI-like domain-containing protein [Luteolibacter sp.]
MTPPRAKHEWRKQEKALYLPKVKPEVIDVPTFRFITLSGEGNPNCPAFAECISALYSIAYGIKMTAKKQGSEPEGYFDFTVYPLEGVWDIKVAARVNFSGAINKDDLVFKLMLRQPDFVEESFFQQIMESVKKRKPHPLHERIKFEEITEGRCIQMLHIGSFDDEPASFRAMEEFATSLGEERRSKLHREIYLSDFRKTPTERLKTVLRFQLK